MTARHSFPALAGAFAIAIATLAVPQARAAGAADHAGHGAQPAAAAAQDLLSEGEVRKVDRAAGKVTLRHGPLANLDMPAMTMVFTVPDPKLLDGLAVGSKVRFTADRKDGVYLVTAIRVVP